MNLALHRFLLQVTLLSVINLQHGLLCSAGEPGYLDFDNLPETNFSCQGKVIGGYYADVEAGCQMFHVCTIGQKDEIMDIKFLCLNGTVFDQETRVCERVDEVDCSKSERFYNLNLELYGNNAVTLSLHDNSEDELDQSEPIEDHQRSTSARPTTTTTTTTTTSKPKPSTTPSSNSFSHQTGYPQPFQPQPPFHTSQSKSLYDDKNGGYHHQYIFHNGERNNNNQQATSYQLFSNQGVSTTVQPQVHQIRFSSTPSPQIIHNEPSTVAPLFHSSSTIQTLLNSNGNSPSLINPIFHNHGIASTTEQFSIHSNNPRETSEYRENAEEVRSLETNKAKVSVSPTSESRSVQTKTSSSSQQQRISGNFLPTPSTDETTVRSFYPTPRASPKTPSQASQSTSEQVTQHIHVLPPVQIPQLKPHQITINIPPPDIQRIVQSPSSLLPSQSRVIVTAKASVSDESGRPLNTSQLVTLPLPTIPASYDDYKEGDESFDPFYRDVPKIRNGRRIHEGRDLRWHRNDDLINDFSGELLRDRSRSRRSVGQTKSSMVTFYNGDKENNDQVNKKKVDTEGGDFQSLKESLIKFRDILFGSQFTDDVIRSVFEGSKLELESPKSSGKNSKRDLVDDSQSRASKNLKSKNIESENKTQNDEGLKLTDSGAEEINLDSDFKDEEKNVQMNDRNKSDSNSEKDVKDIDIVILDPNEYLKTQSENENQSSTTIKVSTELPITSTTEQLSTINRQKTSRYLRKPNTGENSKDEKKEERTETRDERPQRRRSSRVRPRGKLSSRRRVESERIETSTETVKTEAERIDKNIFEEPESQTSKGVDTRAVSDRNSYSKNQAGKETELGKENRKSTANEYETLKEQVRNTENSEKNLKNENVTSLNLEEEIKEPEKVEENKEVNMNNTKNEESVKEPEEETVGTQIDEDKTVKIIEEDIKETRIETKSKETEDSIKDKTIKEEYTEESKKEAKDGNINKEEVAEDRNTNKEEIAEDRNMSKEEIAEDGNRNKEEIAQNGNTNKEISEKENEEKTKKENSEDLEDHLTQEKRYYEEKSSIEHETIEDVSTTIFGDDSEEDSQELVKSSRKKYKNSSKEITSYKEEKNKKLNDEGEEESKESHEYSTTKSEEFNSEEFSTEYQESTEAFYGSTYEDPEDEYPFGSFEDTTLSSERFSSEENDSSLSEQEDSTEGVLKFTDELPKDKKEDTLESRKSSESEESMAHDYVDDNYEPENYKERESSDSNSLSDEKINKEMMADGRSEEAAKTGKNETTESPKTFRTRTTTTTVRPTPPKLFKPIAVRKNYNYFPPTTTPNPVVIKPRLSLLNPKPAKPPKSYNELVPKPVIRKFPLLSRKSTTTMQTTTKEEEFTETTEVMTTEAITTTEASRSEENVLEGKLESVNESQSIINSDLVQESQLKAVNDSKQEYQLEMKSEGKLNDTEADEKLLGDSEESDSSKDQKLESEIKSKEQKLESEVKSKGQELESEIKSKDQKLESEIKSKDQKLESEIKSKNESEYKNMDIKEDHPPLKSDDQDTSPNEQKTSTDTEKTEAFTPYPISKLSTLASNIEKAFKEASSTESEKSTLMEIELSSTVSPVTLTTTDQSTESSTIKTSTEEAEIVQTSTKPADKVSLITSSPETPSTTEEATKKSMNTRKMMLSRRYGGFNCLEKEMYRFYGDDRDCRLFHYCSPGFTSRQVLDFRFVCEEGTTFDEETQSCRHDVRNRRFLQILH